MTNTLIERTDEQKEIDRIVLARVKRGIRKLKAKHGDKWVEKIDLRTLKLDSGACCVLGQVYKESGSWKEGYGIGCRDLGFPSDSQEAIENGFLVPHWKAFEPLRKKEWSELQEAWERELTALITGDA